MPSCPSCAASVPPGSRFCPACGAPHASGGPGDTETSLPQSPRSGRLHFSGSSDEGRFLPGAVLAGRYRVIGLAGRGGMGEVYRADDLKLGQPVALKFLPPAIEEDPGRLARLLNEVRTARQVSHPNVCRVYDVGELEGHHFLSMEYVDGEDLASLLLRIGRLPKDKALQVARQICAGLAAAHDQGILHRDLKPANIMIDGRGRARITDFGLATLRDQVRGEEVRAGTPSYMAPEQLAGKDVSARSDIYALGLVLYEVFTGRPAFSATSVPQLMRLHEQSSAKPPSSVVDGLDPAVDRALLRCLERDPAARPVSALAVAAALPGGDPLAAALAAGETPSPEMVAAAGAAEGLKPWIGATLLATTVLALGLLVPLGARSSLLKLVALDIPPEVLVGRAREILKETGHATPPKDSIWRFYPDWEYLNHVEESDKSPTRWAKIPTVHPAAIGFEYLESPRPIVPQDRHSFAGYGNPPFETSGMAVVWLDPDGSLRGLQVVPPERDESPTDAGVVPDWARLFQRAGLDLAAFVPVPPAWNPLLACDRRFAWTGAHPDQPDVPLRVEAGTYRGAPIYFDVLSSWRKPSRMEAQSLKAGQKATFSIVIVIITSCLVGALVLARRNLRLGRGDRRGALRLSVFALGLIVFAGVLSDHHVASPDEMNLVIGSLESGALGCGFFWLIYLALEPYVRKLWPGVLVTWSRVLIGRIRDPRVGVDVLAGAAAGCCAALLGSLRPWVQSWSGVAGSAPGSNPFAFDVLRGARSTIAALAAQLGAGTFFVPLITLFLLLLLRMLLRRQSLAVAAFVGLLILLDMLNSDAALIEIPFSLMFYCTLLIVLIRLGFLATMVFAVCVNLCAFFLSTASLSAWYAPQTWLAPVIVLGLALYGFVVAQAGRSLFRDSLMEN